MGAPIVVALNMMDIAKSRHIEIDVEALAKRLGCPVIPIFASAEKGIEALKAGLIHTALERSPPNARIVYAPARRDLYSGDRLPIPRSLCARRFRLHGARRIRHGPLDAVWQKWLSRRDRRSRFPKNRFSALLQRHPLPAARIVHRYTFASKALP